MRELKGFNKGGGRGHGKGRGFYGGGNSGRAFGGGDLRRKSFGQCNRTIQIDAEKCKCCGACAKACPQGVFEMIKNEEERSVEVKHFENCIRCGKCFDACKFDALSVVRK